MSFNITRVIRKANNFISLQAKRNFGVAAPALQKVSDPIQHLFLDKLQEYKKKSSGDGLVEATPETERELKQELLKLAKRYGGKEGVEMTKFPDIKFVDAKLDPIDMVE